MRQGQHNRRGRNRNRKSQNPLSRSYESNGPDVKIRGNAQHIAEKYMSLARDAQSSSDPVLAENYLQHAEHYNRIIMAFREQQGGYAGDGMNGGRRFDSGDGADDGSDDDMDDGGLPEAGSVSGMVDLGSGHQPDVPDMPLPYEERAPVERPQQERHDRGDRHERNGRNDQRHGGDRNYGDRGGNDRGHRHERHNRGYDQRRDRRHDQRNHDQRNNDRNNDYAPRYSQPQEQPSAGYAPQNERRPEPLPPQVEAQPPVVPTSGSNGGHNPSPLPPAPQASTGGRPEGGGPRRRERYVPTLNDQPEFLRRPVKRPRREASNPDAGGDALVAPSPAETATSEERD